MSLVISFTRSLPATNYKRMSSFPLKITCFAHASRYTTIVSLFSHRLRSYSSYTDPLTLYTYRHLYDVIHFLLNNDQVSSLVI